MKAATERKIIRWFHIIASIPIIGFIYGPVSQIPRAAAAVRWAILPAVILTGLWLWKGHLVKRWLSAGPDGNSTMVKSERRTAKRA